MWFIVRLVKRRKNFYLELSDLLWRFSPQSVKNIVIIKFFLKIYENTILWKYIAKAKHIKHDRLNFLLHGNKDLHNTSKFSLYNSLKWIGKTVAVLAAFRHVISAAMDIVGVDEFGDLLQLYFCKTKTYRKIQFVSWRCFCNRRIRIHVTRPAQADLWRVSSVRERVLQKRRIHRGSICRNRLP